MVLATRAGGRCYGRRADHAFVVEVRVSPCGDVEEPDESQVGPDLLVCGLVRRDAHRLVEDSRAFRCRTPDGPGRWPSGKPSSAAAAVIAARRVPRSASLTRTPPAGANQAGTSPTPRHSIAQFDEGEPAERLQALERDSSVETREDARCAHHSKRTAAWSLNPIVRAECSACRGVRAATPPASRARACPQHAPTVSGSNSCSSRISSRSRAPLTSVRATSNSIIERIRSDADRVRRSRTRRN